MTVKFSQRLELLDIFFVIARSMTFSLSHELGYLARRELAVLLDHESPQGRDWMGLADRMGFAYSTTLALKRERSPTLALLEEWERAVGEWVQCGGQPLSLLGAVESVLIRGGGLNSGVGLYYTVDSL